MKKTLIITALIAFSLQAQAMDADYYQIIERGAKECFSAKVIIFGDVETTLGDVILSNSFNGETLSIGFAPGANQVYFEQYKKCREDYFSLEPELEKIFNLK